MYITRGQCDHHIGSEAMNLDPREAGLVEVGEKVSVLCDSRGREAWGKGCCEVRMTVTGDQLTGDNSHRMLRIV
jgi:hypothetical protein